MQLTIETNPIYQSIQSDSGTNSEYNQINIQFDSMNNQ